MIYRIMAWYGFAVTLAIIVSGLTFGVLYHHRTAGKWRNSELGRHLMAFVLSPTAVLITAMIPIHQVWWILFSLAVYTTVPLVYIQRILIFLKVQKESDVPDQSD